MGDVMREAYKRGWITTRDGNISVKTRDTLYITPTAVRKYTIQVEDIVKLPLKDGGIYCGDLKTSIELDMHWMIQKQRGVKAVVHLHPTHIVAALHAGFDLKMLAASFVELGRYTRVGDNVPFCPPGSNDLANMTSIAIENADIVGQIGHGVTAKAKNPWDAFEHIERLNHICEIVLLSGVRPE